MGIVAGSPGLYQTGTHLASVLDEGLKCESLSGRETGATREPRLRTVRCEDGLKDGLIDDPRRCDFKPARDLPRCAGGTDGADCFTADQIKALELILRRCDESRKTIFSRLAGGSGNRRAKRTERMDWTRDQRAGRPRRVDDVWVQFSALRRAGGQGA